MDYLNLASQVASILGFGLSAWAVWRLRGLHQLLRLQSRNRSILAMMEEVSRFPSDKESITPTNVVVVEQIVQYVELFYVSRVPLIHGPRKKLLRKLKQELTGGKLTVSIQGDVKMIRDELFTVENH